MDAGASIRAACVRCGAVRNGLTTVCPACGNVPQGEALALAWLLSSHHLTAAEVDAAGERIRGGGAVRPDPRALDRARRALGRHAATDPGLSVAATVGLFALSLLVTPLPALGAAWTWWEPRPLAARTALAVSVPALVLLWVLRGVTLWRDG